MTNQKAPKKGAPGLQKIATKDFYLDTVGLQGFGVDIDQTVELTFTSLAFSVVSQSVIKIKPI